MQIDYDPETEADFKEDEVEKAKDEREVEEEDGEEEAYMKDLDF